MSNSSTSIYIPTTLGSNSFRLKHKGDSIFYKVFNGSSSSVVDLQNNKIQINNHFFKTGEKLKYQFPNRGTSIGISTLSPGNSISTSLMPTEVYPIVLDSNNIKLAFSQDLALSGQSIDITSLGIGENHSLECEKQNSKCLISIDNIIQSPISIGSSVQILLH
jgi:hypothetical protein